jgi:threonine synthase
MTTVPSANVHCIAVEGTFDDCQDLVKAMFADTQFRESARLSAVNSINWARIVAQIVYYFHAAVSIGGPDRPVSFAVPTGNFGNVFAAYAAKACGLPIDQLIIGTNSNDILTRFFETGTLAMGDVHQSISPSMDIQVSSNFERFMFDLYGRDGAALSAAMAEFRKDGTLSVGDNLHRSARETISAGRLNDTETMVEMKRQLTSTGELIDPHTAIGIAAGRAQMRQGGAPVIAQAAAHPAKFPDAVETATGVRPKLPPHLADLLDRPEHFDVLSNDLDAIQAHVRQHISPRGAA